MRGWSDNAPMGVYRGAEYLALRVSLRVAHARKVGPNHPDGARALLEDASRLVAQMAGGDKQAWGLIVADALRALAASAGPC